MLFIESYRTDKFKTQQPKTAQVCYSTEFLRFKNVVSSPRLTQGAACLGLVHGDDPERCCGEEGGRGVHVWERM